MINELVSSGVPITTIVPSMIQLEEPPTLLIFQLMILAKQAQQLLTVEFKIEETTEEGATIDR